MKPTTEQLQSLLALKRDVRPEAGYWQDFLCDFHQRQREDAVKKSALVGWWQVVSRWVGELGGAKWAYGAGLAYATVALGFALIPTRPDVETAPAVPVSHQVVPAPAAARPVQQLQQLDLDPASQGSTGEQVF